MIIVTGTPGVGKHTIAKILAKRLKLGLLDVNEIAFKYDAVIDKEDDTAIIDVEKVRERIKEFDSNYIIVGHLAPYVVDDIDYAIVLRRSPYELEKIYSIRGYNDRKSRDNLASEILGIIAYDCIVRFGIEKIIEIDCTASNIDDIVEEIIRCINNRENKTGIDWLSLVASNNDMKRFFDL
ncbi:MAG: AAA family ATPase [Candidatus Nitrosocaldaceae archaeon]